MIVKNKEKDTEWKIRLESNEAIIFLSAFMTIPMLRSGVRENEDCRTYENKFSNSSPSDISTSLVRRNVNVYSNPESRNIQYGSGFYNNINELCKSSHYASPRHVTL